MGRLRLRGYESGPKFFPFYKLVIMPTMDFDPNRILIEVGPVPLTTGRSKVLPKVRFVPLTTGRSVSGIFF